MKTGDRFERLTIIEQPFRVKKISKEGNIYTASYVKVKCDCGVEKTVSPKGIIRGDIRSCGCLAIEIVKSRKTHGRTKTREYRIWVLVKDRCNNPNNPAYKYYGGRGIKIHDDWESSFSNFLMDMGESPTERHSLDRIRNNGNYEPWNCRWATSKTQQNNKSTTVYLTLNGVTQPMAYWAEQYGIKRTTLWNRVYYLGWTAEEAILTKPDSANRLYAIRNP